jgi:hypothetical protein
MHSGMTLGSLMNVWLICFGHFWCGHLFLQLFDQPHNGQTKFANHSLTNKNCQKKRASNNTRQLTFGHTKNGQNKSATHS